MSKKSETILRRLTEAGVPLDVDALSAKFNLALSPIVTFDVDVRLLIDIANRIKIDIRESDFSCELKNIIVVPMILNPDISVVLNSIKWKRADKAYIFKINIDFQTWRRARIRGRKKIIFDVINNAILDIPEKHLNPDNREALIRLVRLSFI